jgi:hypothetical protein
VFFCLAGLEVGMFGFIPVVLQTCVISSKYFFVIGASNLKHSDSYGDNFKCARTGKDAEI